MAGSTDGGVVGSVRDADTGILATGVGAVVAFVLLSLLAGPSLGTVTGAVNSFMWEQLPWLYLVPTFLFVLFAIGLAAGPWGSRRIGEGPPEFGFLTYFAMVFSAGIAAGIVFWGPAEAIYHFSTVPPFLSAEAGTRAAAVGAVQYTLFHWGLTPWAAYTALAVPIGYFAYAYDAPLRVSTALLPLFGTDGLDSPGARVVDGLALLATLGGLGTSIGLIARQFLSAVQFGFAANVGGAGIAGTVLVFATVFTVATVTGLRRGIRRIALVNLGLFALIGLAVLVLGPTGDVAAIGGAAVAGYLVDFVPMSLYAGDRGWIGSWTVFYWAWWLSWAPFVGLFIARVSKGRTVRQVTATTVLGGAGATMTWYVIFGGAATSIQLAGRSDILGPVSEIGNSVSGFPLFAALPFGDVLVLLFFGAIVTFLVTSANASTLSLSMLAERGTESPSTGIRVVWGALQGVAAATLILLGEAATLQTASLVTGAPFAIVGLLAAGCLAYGFAGNRDAVAAGAIGSSGADASDGEGDGGSTVAETD
jgi:glycine betaine transporter